MTYNTLFKSQTVEYRAWLAMKQRCTNKKCKNYNDYGGRGIKVCDEWMISFDTFLNDVGHKPSPKHSLDRIDNNGNYEPGNVRWSTQRQQQLNKRQYNKYGYTGIDYTKSGKWTARITYYKKLIHLGTFQTRDEAIKARIQAELYNH